MKWYGIKFNGKPLGYSTRSNSSEDDFCGDVEYRLESNHNNVWLVKTKSKAELAMRVDTKWYNADYETPSNPYVGESLEIFEIEI